MKNAPYVFVIQFLSIGGGPEILTIPKISLKMAELKNNARKHDISNLFFRYFG